jgi:GDP-mannose 6-dehydrogenase
LKEDHKVVGVDVSADKAARITVGLSPVSDPGLEELLAAGREDGWLSADTDLGGQLDDADMAMIFVGGPSLMGSGLDLIQVGAVSEVLGVALKTRGPARDPLIVT